MYIGEADRAEVLIPGCRALFFGGLHFTVPEIQKPNAAAWFDFPCFVRTLCRLSEEQYKYQQE